MAKQQETKEKKEPELTRKEKLKEVLNEVVECNDVELDAFRDFLKKLRSGAEDVGES